MTSKQNIIQDPLILQFGTSRFLQAHVDYFVGKSLSENKSKTPIAVIQTSNSVTGKQRVRAMNEKSSYPVRIQGLCKGKLLNYEEQISSIKFALNANDDWQSVIDIFCENTTHVISNTADQGYQLFNDDNLSSFPPKSFPAKLLQLLFARYQYNEIPITLMPCELIANNGLVLKEIVIRLAKAWQYDNQFINWLSTKCIWVNSLVDRIVSQSIEPLGAITEPYALWAIEKQDGLVIPCHHKAIHLVDNLASIEWLKLSILNLSHTYLVDLWMQKKASNILTVQQAMENEYLRQCLETLLAQEVVPALEAMSLGENIQEYLSLVRDRFLNPFLNHQLSDIADNHQSKVERRILPIYLKVLELRPDLNPVGLKTCLLRNNVL